MWNVSEISRDTRDVFLSWDCGSGSIVSNIDMVPVTRDTITNHYAKIAHKYG